MKVLLSAPFVGEIGWELLSWQGRVRRVFYQNGFDRLVVLGAPGKSAFYADMPLDYRPVDLSGLPGAAYEDRRVCEETRQPLAADTIRAGVVEHVEATLAELNAAGGETEVLWPDYSGRIWPCDAQSQTFIRFERPAVAPQPIPHVVLVQRTRRFRSADNWSSEAWAELADRLHAHGIHTSAYPNEAEAAIALLSGADLAVGQSTGGLHLAALCACPLLVWAQDESYRASPWEMTDRQRYQTLWNPLSTPVCFHAVSAGPRPETVAEWVQQALVRIGRRTGSLLASTAFRCAWRVRNCIDRRVVRRPWFRQWPWPVQRFVRYSLV